MTTGSALVATAVVLGFDVALLALAAGVLALCVVTVAMALGIAPERSTRRRRKPSREALALPPGPTRRVITGTPPRLPETVPMLALPVADPSVAGPRRESTQSPPVSPTRVAEAERMITELLDQHPQLVARALASWIAADDSRRPRS